MECHEIELVLDHEPSSISKPVKTLHNLPVFTVEKSLFSSILTRFHAGYFRITLSLAWQSSLWKTLFDPKTNPNLSFHTPPFIHSIILITLWSFSLLILLILSLLYMLRCFFRFKMVKQEFLHHVGVNYLFAPWISWLLILQSSPFVAPKYISYQILWWVFATPVILLDIKIYGQWFTKGKRFLTAVANPTSQLSVIGNLVGARAAARMGWYEVSVGLFSLGMVHYLVLFVTLYQRLSGGDRIPAMLRPVFFLFFAAPSMASLAWDTINGRFDIGSKMLFFLSLFIFTSLICRPALFRKSMRRYNIAWWAYSYPITLLAQAATQYAREVNGGVPRGIMLILSALSVLVILGLLVFTALNSKMLLPDDDPLVFTNSLPTYSQEHVVGETKEFDRVMESNLIRVGND